MLNKIKGVCLALGVDYGKVCDSPYFLWELIPQSQTGLLHLPTTTLSPPPKALSPAQMSFTFMVDSSVMPEE